MGIDTLVSEPMVTVWSLLGALLGTLLLVAGSLWAGALVTRQTRTLWHTLRGQRKAVVAAVDEPTDPLIAQLATLTQIPGTVWAAFLPAFFTALADGLDQALSESPDPEPKS